MSYSLRLAFDDESVFGWRLYGAFIADNIFPIANSTLRKSEWLELESARFHKAWHFIKPVMIEENSAVVGWASYSRCSMPRITVQNFYTIDDNTYEQVAPWFLSEMKSEWHAKKIDVDVMMFKSATKFKLSDSILTASGFNLTKDGDLSAIYTSSYR